MNQLTVAQAAKTSGLSPATIKRKIASGELKSTLDKQGWNKIDHGDLMNFLATTQLSKTSSVKAAHERLRAGASSESAQLTDYLGLELSASRERVKELELNLKEAQGEIRKLEAELRAHLSGGVTQALSRWIKRI
jgi:multidrug resistance efflux pump